MKKRVSKAALKAKQQKLERLLQTERMDRLRERVYKKYGKICLRCFIKPGQVRRDGSVARIEVDHIKPKSIYPSLIFRFDNLQPLCDYCNKAKGHKGRRDYRPRSVWQKTLYAVILMVILIVFVLALAQVFQQPFPHGLLLSRLGFL